MPWPAIIAGITSLAGGLLSKRANEKAQNQALDVQQENNERNIQLQKDFAQQGIRWKTEDAKAAGLHPLAALGTQTTGFQPVSIMTDSSAPSNLGDTLSRMGQNVSQAWQRQATADERLLANMKLEQEYQKLVGMKLANAGLRQQISGQQGPAFPDPVGNPYGLAGQGDTSYQDPGYRNKPDDIPYSQRPGLSAGRRPVMDEYAYPGGTITEFPNEKISEALESGSFVDRWKHSAVQVRNAYRNLKGFLGDDSDWRNNLRLHRPAAEPGFINLWNPYLQTWESVPSYPGDTRLFYDVQQSKQRYAIER